MSRITPSRLAISSLALMLAAGAFSVSAEEAKPAASAVNKSDTLRVCAAEAQPPLSLKDESGLENRIAVALAEAMGRKTQFVWSSKPAIYLVRDYLDKNQCDVIIGLDTGDPRVLTSKPYYRTGYVFLTKAESNIDIKSWSDPRIKSFNHIAVPFGSPAEAMLKEIGEYENDMSYLYSLVNFRSPRNQYTQIDPARMVGEVATGNAELAAAFAPDIARFVKSSATPLRMTLIEDDAKRSDGQKIGQRYDQSIGVRLSDKELLAEVNAGLERAKPRIDKILADEGVPLLPIVNPVAAH